MIISIITRHEPSHRESVRFEDQNIYFCLSSEIGYNNNDATDQWTKFTTISIKMVKSIVIFSSS